MPKRGASKAIEMKVIAEREPEDEAMSNLITRLEQDADGDDLAGTITLR
ncbi:MAG TPA: hypothetical protein VFY10_07560 [Dehalococcoidia bacterium]|nr:hypothetical protein [Dehalococcoidia bacterium]